MADKKHLKLLNKGVEAWNEWRKNYPEIKPNLRGANLSKKNLALADFSNADIRNTNFRGANLRGAKFRGAKAGLGSQWRILLVVVSWLLALISGFFSGAVGHIVSQIALSPRFEVELLGWISLMVVIIFFFATFCRGIISALEAVAVVFAYIFASFFAGVGGFEVLAYAFAGVFGLVGPLVGVYAFALVKAYDGAYALAFAFAGVGVCVGSAVNLVFAAAGAIMTLLCADIAWQALEGNEKYALIGNITIAFVAIGGTSFRGADLTDADFKKARLKSTDLRRTNLTRTCWRDTHFGSISFWQVYKTIICTKN